MSREFVIRAPVGAVNGGRGGIHKSLAPMYWCEVDGIRKWLPQPDKAMRFKTRVAARNQGDCSNDDWIIAAPARLTTRVKLGLGTGREQARANILRSVNKLLAPKGLKIRLHRDHERGHHLSLETV
jgi:hypothetical protein